MLSSFILFRRFIYFHVSVCFACMYVCVPCVGIMTKEQEKNFMSRETGVTDCECSELKMGPLKEHAVLLLTDSSRHPSASNHSVHVAFI